MFCHCLQLRAIVSLTIVLLIGGASATVNAADDDAVDLILTLLADQDKEIRALALEQVRTEAKGEVATKKFAAKLASLPPAIQMELLAPWPTAATRLRNRRYCRPLTTTPVSKRKLPPSNPSVASATPATSRF